MRCIVNDGMDIQGGSGICLGPKNYLGRLYQVIPVCITVEGANILTRTMMVFGQGAVRCHPFIYKEIQVLHQQDKAKALKQFDQLLFAHLGFIMRNKVASFWLGVTNAHFINTPGDKQTLRYYQKITRLSTAFAFLTDYAVIVLGGSLKRKERISGQFADVLSNLYLCSTVLKYFQDQGRPEGDLPLVHWACQQTLYQAQQSLFALFRLLPFKPLVWGMKFIIFPFGRSYSIPGDKLVHQTSSILINDSATRNRLTQGIYINEIENDATGRIECAFNALSAAIPIEKKIRQALKDKQLSKGQGRDIFKQALDKDIISSEELVLLKEAERTRCLAIMVDDFSVDKMKGG
jgi:acyl-CoA dehydrogenase